MTAPLKPGVRRNKMIAAIKIGQKQLGWSDDVYRDILEQRYGLRSSTRLTIDQMSDLLGHMKRNGFKSRPPKRAGNRRQAQGSQQSKIRALWLSLYHLGEITDPSEAALEAFARRTSGVDSMAWLNGAKADAVIRALRGWCKRVGFHQPMADDVIRIGNARVNICKDAMEPGFPAKVFLIELQWKKLKEADAFRHNYFAHLGTWLAHNGGVSSPVWLTAAAADKDIEKLGRWLRKAKKKQAEKDAPEQAVPHG